MIISVIIPTHNPRLDFLNAALETLRNQTLPSHQWELLIVDNCSEPQLSKVVDLAGHQNGRIIREEQLGLTHARRRGFVGAKGKFFILVDDDNVLAKDYLENVVRLFDMYPNAGAIGGKCFPQFEQTPPAWITEFLSLLACRDLGNELRISDGLKPPGAVRNTYPLFAPIGAGMAMRRETVQGWLNEKANTFLPDRRGNELTSGGDNDIVLAIMQDGWEVGYFPELKLFHLISARRMDADYLARLNHGIQKSWQQVLTKHQASPWPLIPGWTLPLRKLKAWFTYRAWAGPVERIRWRGVCGHFEGRT